MTDRITKPKHSLTLTRYSELEQVVRAFGDGRLNFMILIGSHGIAKSQTVRRIVGSQSCWIEGNATSFGIYQQLYLNQNKPVVIDDVDSLYSDRAAVRLLKCLCQTDPVKSLAWHSAATSLNDEGIPRQFETRSQTMIIANDWKTLDANVAAVQDRGHLVFFEPSAREVHHKVGEWFKDKDVYAFFERHLHLIPEPSMRHYARAAELKSIGLDWVKTTLGDVVPEKALLVAKIQSDPSYTDERARVLAFRALGGGGQTTWYKWAGRLKQPSQAAA